MAWSIPKQTLTGLLSNSNLSGTISIPGQQLAGNLLLTVPIQLNASVGIPAQQISLTLSNPPQLVGQIFARVLKDIDSGALPQLPCTTFAFERAPDAFRHMAQARHIGRVVFRHRVEPRRLDAPVRGDATYLITGGLKGLGLLAAQWLVGQGARHLLLAGRSAPDAAATETIAAMAAAGARVVVVSADLADDAGVAKLMQALDDGLPPLGGVLHGAAVLDDGMLARQSPARLACVMGPKADGAWRLHAALEALVVGLDELARTAAAVSSTRSRHRA